jgi:lantibiotic biosynthesis protein
MSAREEFLATADAIGRRLCRDALWAGGQANWLGWSMEPVGGAFVPAYRSFGPDLYSGTSGVALFLSRLHRFTGDPVQRATAEAAVRQAQAAAAAVDGVVRSGFYAGITGIAWAQLEIGTLFEREDWIEWALEQLADLRGVPSRDWGTDVIAGSAGAIPALLDVARRFGRDDLAELAVLHGEHLLRTADRGGEGWSWDTMRILGQRNLTGHSHGTAGIACSLLELHRETGEERFREAALEALHYERARFNAERGNWPDFRRMDPAVDSPPAYVLAWCHGAPGIGLSRLRIWELMEGDASVLAEVEAALRVTVEALAWPVVPEQGGNYSLCHGAGGNAELLLVAADRLERPGLRAAAEAVGLRGIEAIARPRLPWPCGLAQAGETPGLMLGLAGIGYFYLRLYDPAAVPSALIVTPGGGEMVAAARVSSRAA